MDRVVEAPAGDGLAKRERKSQLISVVLKYWREFDLEREKGKLDKQGLRIGENQEKSLKTRRKLAESTQDFRKNDHDDKTKAFASLVKAFQEEVDSLTKRAKYGENAFLNVYQKLYEAPDPLPALISADELATKVAELEIENRKMSLELEEFRTAAAHLKNQQPMVKVTAVMKQRSVAEDNPKTLEVLKEREQSLQDQSRAAKGRVQNMQRLRESDQSQLFELPAQSEKGRAAKQSELNLLTDEVDRATAGLISLVREKTMGYNSVEAEDWESANREENIGKLETLLLEEDRRMEHELTQPKAEDWEIITHGENIRKLETLLLEKDRRMERELTLAKEGQVDETRSILQIGLDRTGI